AGQVVGKVVDVVDSPAQSLLKIRLTEPVVTGQNSKGEDVVEKTALVPFVEELVPDIDLEEQYLTLDPPGGLIPGL
ncbi:MAG: PRC-barrel domain-containing protein, partial [Bifidobacterium breve]